MTYEAKRSKKVSGWTTWSGTREELVAYLESEGCMDGAMMVEGAERPVVAGDKAVHEIILSSGLGVRALATRPITFESQSHREATQPGKPLF